MRSIGKLLAGGLMLLAAMSKDRRDFLESRVERAQSASLAQLATDESLAYDLGSELLENAGVLNVVLRRNNVRQLALSSPIPEPISATYDLRDQPFWTSIREALALLKSIAWTPLHRDDWYELQAVRTAATARRMVANSSRRPWMCPSSPGISGSSSVPLTGVTIRVG